MKHLFFKLPTVNRHLSTRFLGAPAGEASFLQINFLGGYPRGGVPPDRRPIGTEAGGQGDTSPTKN